MFHHKTRRFRRRSNGRNHMTRDGQVQTRPRPNQFLNGPARNNFRTPLSAEKLLEKYNSLAKEAMSSGDKTLSENYFQHADHFMRIVEEKNKSQNNNKLNSEDNKNSPDSDQIKKIEK